MAKIQFENGQTVEFDGMPSRADIEEAAAQSSDRSSEFAGLSPTERGKLAVRRLGPPEPASAVDVGINVMRGVVYAARDIPAGIEQIAMRALPFPESMKEASAARISKYEAEKGAALEKPGGTVGYVGGQLATAFVPGAGPVKVAANAEKIIKALAYVKPIAIGAGLTAAKPFETEAERLKETGISAALGTVIPAVSGAVRSIGGAIRPPSGPGAPPGAGGLPPSGGFGDAFIRKLKASPESRKRGELIEKARELSVVPSPGQVAAGLPKFLEEQMAKLPGSRGVAEKATRESYESFHRALGREIGAENTPYLTMDVIDAAKRRLGEVYDEILPQARIVGGTAGAGKLAFDAEKLTAPFSEVVSATIPKSALRNLERVKAGILAGLKSGEISGDDLKVLQTHVRELGEDQNLHSAVRGRISNFRQTLQETLAKSLDETNPDLAARFRENDRRWANASILAEIQSSAGSSVEGFVSGPKLLSAVLRRYKNTSKAGNFGSLAEMGQMFYQKLPDSGTADRMMANTILTGGLGAGAVGLIDPATAAGVYALPKLAAHAYYQTPAYQRAVRMARAASAASSRVGASGAGRTGRPEDRP